MTFFEACRRLKDAGIENYRYEATLLIEELCGAFSEDRDYASETLEAAVNRRCTGYPLQYILGKWWFARCEFEVNESCLIPRSDTELIVEYAAKHLPSDARFADLCTGSGCIAVSILDLRADTRAEAYEFFSDTLALATRNAERNRVAERFSPVLGDVLQPDLLGEKTYAAIISNPPYIRRDVIPTLAVEVQQEPYAALDGGEDGLVFYRAIVQNFAKNLEENGFFLFEIGYDQANDIQSVATDNGFSCEVFKDLGGCDRMALLKKFERRE